MTQDSVPEWMRSAKVVEVMAKGTCFFVCLFFLWVVMVFVCSHGSSVGENQIWFADMTYYIIRLYVLCAYTYVTCPYTLIDTRVYKNIRVILLQINAPKLP